MQLVYDRLETIESNLYKAYYHFEDIDPELWKIFYEITLDDPDFYISGCEFIYTIHADVNNARLMPYSFLILSNLICFAGLEYEKSNVDSTDAIFPTSLFHFFNTLEPSLLFYVLLGIKQFDQKLFISMIEKTDDEKAAAVEKAFANLHSDFENYLDHRGLHLDSTCIKKGKDILANGSALDFINWISQYDDEWITHLDSFYDFKFQMISNPCFSTNDNFTKENAISYVDILKYCVKKHETEYLEWKTENAGIKWRKTAFISIIDFGIGRFSLHFLFYLYYSFVEGRVLDNLFYAINEETSDGDLNKLLVEAVRNYPDPQFAIEVNERYKEYKRYNPGCIDLPFVDQDAEPKLMAPPNRQEDNTRNFDVRLGKYLEVSLEWEDVAALYNCFYQMFDSETKRGDILYYLSTGADDGLVHNGIKWQGSREELALFLQGVLPRKKRGFWKAVYKVFRIKKNDEWVKTKDLNKINSREWDTKDNRKECEKLESLYNIWMIRRPNLKGKWEFRDWHKNS